MARDRAGHGLAGACLDPGRTLGEIELAQLGDGDVGLACVAFLGRVEALGHVAKDGLRAVASLLGFHCRRAPERDAPGPPGALVLDYEIEGAQLADAQPEALEPVVPQDAIATVGLDLGDHAAPIVGIATRPQD